MDDQEPVSLEKSENTTQTPAPVVEPAKGSKRSKWVLWTVVAVAIVTLGLAVAAVMAFSAWNNSSQKVLLDAAKYAMEQPGLYTYSGLDNKITIQKGDGVYSASIVFKDSNLDFVADSSAVYFKADDVAKLFSLATGSEVSTGLDSFMKPLFDKVKGKWVYVDLKTSVLKNDSTNKFSCLTDNLGKLTQDNAAREKLASVYVNNQFLTVVDKPSTGTDLNYDVLLDNAKLQSFADGFQQTSFYLSLSSCTDIKGGLLPDLSKVQGSASITLTKDHKFKQIVVSGKDGKDKTTINATYDGLKSIQIPKDATSIDDLFGNIFTGFAQSLQSAIPESR